jgi:hypothetical protein
MRIPRMFLLLAGAVTWSGCQDASSPTHPIALDLSASQATGGALGRYVALGTSISMGVASDGVLGTDQAQAWTAQLARLAETPVFSQPLIPFPGCGAPLFERLASGRRINGELASGPSAVCAGFPLSENDLAMNDLAINGATTHEALAVTPELVAPTDPRRELFSRVLRPGQTQVTEMLAQAPEFVSVELGANELLPGAASGLLVPGVTIVPFFAWRREYDQIIAAVKSTRAKAVLVGLVNDVASLPAFRRGAELYTDGAAFNALYVDVSADCQNSKNLLFVSPVVLRVVALAQAALQQGLAMPVLSCANVPGTVDFVLTPVDVIVLNFLLAGMNAHMQRVATLNRFAFFKLDVLYGRPDLKAPFSVFTLLGLPLELPPPPPFGPLITLDGLHPSPAGHAILARAAAEAINKAHGIPLKPVAAQLVASRSEESRPLGGVP